MGNRFLKIGLFAVFFTGALLMSSCIGDADFTGFFRSSVRVNERFEQSLEWNTQHAPRRIVCENNNYRLFFASDIHIGGTENFQKILNDSKSAETDGLFLVGDIVSGKEEDYNILVESLARESIENYFIQVGNHELYFNGWKWFRQYFGTSVYPVEIVTPLAKDLVICLDTGGGTLGPLQLEWLEELLRNVRQNYRHCIVLHHCNFFQSDFSTSATPLSEELYELMNLFFTYSVDMVIMGHVHISSEENFGPTRYICLDAALDGAKNASYLRLDCSDDHLVYQYISL